MPYTFRFEDIRNRPVAVIGAGTPGRLVPNHQADPEAAALELIVQMPTELLGYDSPMRETLQDFTTVLHGEAVLAGRSWHDAKHSAVAMMFDAINRDDAAALLLGRAERARDDSDGITWEDPATMAQALTLGAKVLGL